MIKLLLSLFIICFETDENRVLLNKIRQVRYFIMALKLYYRLHLEHWKVLIISSKFILLIIKISFVFIFLGNNPNCMEYIYYV